LKESAGIKEKFSEDKLRIET